MRNIFFPHYLSGEPLFSCVCIQRVGLLAYMAVGLVSVLPFDIRPFMWRLKNVSAMSGFVQAVL